MARSKKGRAGKAARYKAVANGGGGGGGSSTGRHAEQDIASYFLPKLAHTQNFSLADEARHTAHNHGTPDSLASLRARPVAFVSAGVVEPLKELDNELIASNFDNGKVQEDDNPSLVTTATVAPHHGDTAAAHGSPDGLENDPFFVDTTGDKSLAQTFDDPVPIPSPQARPPSSSGSSSGADHVVFKGRNHQKQQQEQRRPVMVDNITVQVHVVEQTMQNISLDPAPEPNLQREPSPPIPAWQFRGHNDDADLMADYIANMDNDDDDDGDGDGDARQYQARLPASFGARDLGGAHGDFVMPEEPSSNASSAEDDDDNDDVDDEEDDDEDPEQEEDLEIPEAAEAVFAAAGAGNDMDDETLARLLAKQEELGIDQDELIITSGEMARYNNRFVATSNSRIADFRQSVEAPWKQLKTGARRKIPSAAAVAEVFDDYDLAMDWDRHNPPRKPKAKRGQPTFDLSDEELQAHLQDSFNKDRLRKKERKLERQELRAAGLLGKHGNPEDLRIKYPTGISIGQIKEEMRLFLQGDDETLTFPPMDSNARKSIHEICLRLNIKSKSTGGGDQRRPILHRTKRTGTYREAAFEAAFRPGRKYFPRLDANKPRGGRAGNGGARANGRGVNTAAFTYQDGEVVGGGAPELGINNKGRALMEKMGWSAGMALGANDNQGILQPVAHVVKRTKAGLG